MSVTSFGRQRVAFEVIARASSVLIRWHFCRRLISLAMAFCLSVAFGTNTECCMQGCIADQVQLMSKLDVRRAFRLVDACFSAWTSNLPLSAMRTL